MPKGYRKDGTKLGFQKGYKQIYDRNGIKNSNYKNGKFINTLNGYVYILQHSHPRANKKGYVKQANLVMEKMIGRFLKPQEVVHHKGIKYPIDSIENKQDDRPENLQLFANKSEHTKFHDCFRIRDKQGKFTKIFNDKSL